ncbi:Abi-alpha family protein [uncultured Desulfosarcina sp.]|uniref:Abi-alpha family protein n=1 Tax=uncultured Desulfosarcina sp. TaxID=218289 RepID=UPI003749BF74
MARPQIRPRPNVSLLGQDARCQFPRFVPNYISNLCRLGLLRIRPLSHLTAEEAYAPIINHPDVHKGKQEVEAAPEVYKGFEVEKKYVELTEYGMQFARACIYPPKK